MGMVAAEALLAISLGKFVERERVADAVALQVEAVRLRFAKKLDVGGVSSIGPMESSRYFVCTNNVLVTPCCFSMPR